MTTKPLTQLRLSDDDISDTLAEPTGAATLRLVSDTAFGALRELSAAIGGYQRIEIEFPSFADGRGFSLASRLRSDMNYQGSICAVGHVIPDQQAKLIAAGFDAVKLSAGLAERHGDAWTRVQQVPNQYWQRNNRQNLKSVWDLRAQRAAS